jgi:hypothetical protein
MKTPRITHSEADLPIADRQCLRTQARSNPPRHWAREAMLPELWGVLKVGLGVGVIAAVPAVVRWLMEVGR